MKTKTLTGKSTTMLEINNNDFVDTYYYKQVKADSKYYNAFYDFLVSLNVGVTTEDLRHPHKVTIEDVDFNIDISNASEQSKNAFDRQPKDRKPQNRFIRLTHTWMDAPTVIKIQFNKEYNADNLRKKIASGVAFIKERESKLQARKDAQETNTVRIANHFAAMTSFARDITIERGDISFYLYKIKANVSVDVDGVVTQVRCYGFECKEGNIQAKSMEMFSLLKQAPGIMQSVFAAIAKCGPIPEDLRTWATEDAYRLHYSYEEKKYGY